MANPGVPPRGLGPNDPRGTISAMRGGQGASSLMSTGAGSKLVVDSTDLATLHSRLQVISSDIQTLGQRLDALTPKLTKAGGFFNRFFGAGGTGGGTTTLSASPVSFSTGGQPQQPQGQGLSRGGFSSPPGGMGRTIAMGAAGEIGAQWAGRINTAMTNVIGTGMPIDLMARQNLAIFGGRSPAASVNAFAGISNLGPADLAQAMSSMQGNAFLNRGTTTAGFSSFRNFLNTTQRLNPLLGAAGAGQFAQDLTSPQALNFLTMRGQATQGGGLINALTGGINSPQQTFKSVLAALTGMSQNQITPTIMRNWAKTPARMAALSQNAQGMGLSSADVTSLQQFMAAGGNMQRATSSAVAGSPAASMLGSTTAGTALQMQAFNQSVPVQNAINDLTMNLKNASRGFLGLVPGLSGFGLAVGAATKTLLAMASVGMEAGVLGKGGLGLLGGGGLATGEAGMMGAGRQGLAGIASMLGISSGLGSRLLGRGLLGAGIGIGGNILGNLIRGNSPTGGARAAIGSTISGAATGAGIGMLFGPEGAAAGGIIGGGIGLFRGLGDPPTGSTTTAGMQPNLASRVSAMMRDNPNLKISSGYRTAQQQKNLYAMKGGRGVAAPGHSAHQQGKAADLGPPSQIGWVRRNAQRYGLYNPDPRGEPWHVQAMGDPTGNSVVSAAEKWLGTKYVYGGQGTQPGQGVDCSRFVQEVFASLGVSLPRTTYEQMKVGTVISGGIAKAQPGDLIFYNGGEHVTIYIGNGQLIHAPHTGTTVQIQSVWSGITQINRVVAGAKAAQAAQTAAKAAGGTAATSANQQMGTGTNIGLSNSFMQGLAGSWLAGGGPTGSHLGPRTSYPAQQQAGSASGSGTSSTSGSTATVSGGSSGSINSPTDFSKAVLSALGVAASVADVTDINAWQQAEGQWTASGIYNAKNMHDPLNTKLPEPGSKSLGGLTNSYPTWAEGVAATVSTIQQGNMAPILSALKANASLSSFSSSLESTPWAQSAYGGSGLPAPSGVYAVGDPSSSFMPMSGMGGGMAGIRGASPSHGMQVTLNMPIQVVSASAAEAQRLASMVMQELRSQAAVSGLSSG